MEISDAEIARNKIDQMMDEAREIAEYNPAKGIQLEMKADEAYKQWRIDYPEAAAAEDAEKEAHEKDLQEEMEKERERHSGWWS